MKKQTKYFDPTFQGYTCRIPSYTFNEMPRVMKEHPTIESYYTYTHINMIICAFDINIGFVLYIKEGKAILHYYDTEHGERVYSVRIRRLSMYSNEVYMQLEYLTTLWIMHIFGSDRMFRSYTIAEVLLQIDHFLKKDHRSYFTIALFQIP